MSIHPSAASNSPMNKRMVPLLSSFHLDTALIFAPLATMTKMTISGATKIRLYSTIRPKAAKLKSMRRMVMMARYGAPVHGNSTAATNAPSSMTPNSEVLLVEYSWILWAKYLGICREKPLPYQKKSLISSSAARMTREPTARDRYSAMTIGMVVKA